MHFTVKLWSNSVYGDSGPATEPHRLLRIDDASTDAQEHTRHPGGFSTDERGYVRPSPTQRAVHTPSDGSGCALGGGRRLALRGQLASMARPPRVCPICDPPELGVSRGEKGPLIASRPTTWIGPGELLRLPRRRRPQPVPRSGKVHKPSVKPWAECKSSHGRHKRVSPDTFRLRAHSRWSDGAGP